jgi:hypothetical protein
MIEELIKLATHLDSKGLTREANYLDAVIKKESGFQDVGALIDRSISAVRGLPGGVYDSIRNTTEMQNLITSAEQASKEINGLRSFIYDQDLMYGMPPGGWQAYVPGSSRPGESVQFESDIN